MSRSLFTVTYSDSGVTITGDGEGVTQVWVEATSEYAGNLSMTWNDAYGDDELFVDPIRTQEDGVLTLGDITTTGGLSVEGGVDVTGALTGAYVIAVSSGNISTTITANTFANITAPGFSGTITSNGTASLTVGSGDAGGDAVERSPPPGGVKGIIVLGSET